MAGIEPNLYRRLQDTLLKCSEFKSDSQLKAIFVHTHISPWRNNVPQAMTVQERVQATIDYFSVRQSAKGENGLVLLLLVLSEQIDPGDQLHHDLVQLARELKNSHPVISLPPTTLLGKIPLPYIAVGTTIGCLLVAIIIITIPSLSLIYRNSFNTPTPDVVANRVTPILTDTATSIHTATLINTAAPVNTMSLTNTTAAPVNPMLPTDTTISVNTVAIATTTMPTYTVILTNTIAPTQTAIPATPMPTPTATPIAVSAPTPDKPITATSEAVTSFSNASEDADVAAFYRASTALYSDPSFATLQASDAYATFMAGDAYATRKASKDKLQQNLATVEATETAIHVTRQAIETALHANSVYVTYEAAKSVVETRVAEATVQPTPSSKTKVYKNGQLMGTTNSQGQLTLMVAKGDKLVAIELVEEKESPRSAHTLPGGNKNIAYQVYRTSMPVVGSGDIQPYTVPANPTDLTLTIRPTNALILFNMVVSIEWNANDDYVNSLKEAFNYASDYLYDVTDGQMALGQVTIYSNREYWGDADIRISAKNIRPYSSVGGMFTPNQVDGINLGRLWNGHSSDKGAWNKPAGYRTIIHQFGHYALYLEEEYLLRQVDNDGFSLERSAACTNSSIRKNGDDATNASIMYYQYNASELADRTYNWSSDCEATEQYRQNKESDWETVTRHYKGDNWQLNTPTLRGGVMAGPDNFPQDLLPFPQIISVVSNPNISNINEIVPRLLIVVDSYGKPLPNVSVTSYPKVNGIIIPLDQGLTDINGQITLLGSAAGDKVQAATLNGGLAGSLNVTDALNYILVLRPPIDSLTGEVMPTSTVVPTPTSTVVPTPTSTVVQTSTSESVGISVVIKVISQ